MPPDDQGEKVRALWNAQGDDDASVVRAACVDASLWGTDLSHVPGFVRLVVEYLEGIRRSGINAVLESLLAAERRNGATTSGIKVRV